MRQAELNRVSKLLSLGLQNVPSPIKPAVNSSGNNSFPVYSPPLFLSPALWLHHEYPEFGPLGNQSQESWAILSFSKQGYYTKSKDSLSKGGQEAALFSRSTVISSSFLTSNLFYFWQKKRCIEIGFKFKFASIYFLEKRGKCTQTFV